MVKKILCLLITAALILTVCFTVAFAASAEPSELEMADALAILGLFRGRDDGYALDASLTRVQAVVMLTRYLGKEAEALETEYETPFIDVPEWAEHYVGYAYTENITKGSGDDIFLPDDVIPLNQFLTLLLRFLGYDDAKGDFTYTDPFDKAESIGLITSDFDANSFDRGDMVAICYRMLNVTFKGTDVTVAEKLISDGVFTKHEYEAVIKTVAATDDEIYVPATSTTVPSETTKPESTTAKPTTTTKPSETTKPSVPGNIDEDGYEWTENY